MQIAEAITKYRIQLVDGGNNIKVNAPKNMLDWFRANKPAIIAELKRREAEDIARREQAAARKAAAIAAIKAGTQTLEIKLTYQDGEILQGYTVYGLAAEMLVELRVARDIGGWGIKVDDALVAELGTEFTYAQVQEYARPTLDAQAAAEQVAVDKRDAALAKAKRTGQPVVIARWTDKCDDPNAECDQDIVYRMAMPDGTIKIDRVHTY